MNKLKELRIERNLKQKDIAKELDISTSYYGMIEIGRRRPSLPLAIKLAKFFDLPVEALFIEI